jgi:fructan beta-fructosidase
LPRRPLFLFALITSLVLQGMQPRPHQISKDYDQLYRPQFHFSPQKHWTNDPNGLVFFEGEYHLFFQYNPFGDQWGHMSWGHAVSRDLLHWKELPVAIPEEHGVMIFTGSTVIDERNTSGFCKGGKPCMVAIYTGHTPPQGSKPALETQNIAYSNDRGRTWTKYRQNPVLNLHLSDFRDPKVFWSQQKKRWTMVVALPNDHKVRLYASPNLKRWTAISEFGPAGAVGGQWECPELFELPLRGSSTETRWVLKVGINPGGVSGGSGEQYFVGRFDGQHFKNDNPPALTLWTDYGKDCYCALTFSGLSRRPGSMLGGPVMIGWMDNWQYASKLPTAPWRGQMTLPRKLSLRRTAEGIRLIQNPLDSLVNLRGARTDVSDSLTLPERAFELSVTHDLKDTREIGWKLLAKDEAFATIGYDRRKRVVFVERLRTATAGFSKDFPQRMEAALRLSGSVLSLDIVVDRSSVEVFADSGRITMTNLVFPAEGNYALQFYSIGDDGKLSSGDPPPASLWRLKSAH